MVDRPSPPGAGLAPQGTSVRLVLRGCDLAALVGHRPMLRRLAEAARRSGLLPLESVGHDFPGPAGAPEPGGYTACLVLAESHVTVHTYPEAGRSALVEISVCDHLRDNRLAARALAAAVAALFAPAAVRREEVRWGELGRPEP